MCCESKMINKGGDDVDIGCGNSFGGDTGEDGPADDTVQKVNNVIDGFQYTETSVGSAIDLKGFLKDYFNAIVLKLREMKTPKEEIQAFKATCPLVATFLIKNFKELQFYLGPSFCPESMVFSIYPDGAVTPNFYFIMGGFKSEKF